MKTWFVKVSAEELELFLFLSWVVQSPDLNPSEHLRYELERHLQLSPSFPTSLSDLNNALVSNPHRHALQSSGKPF